MKLKKIAALLAVAGMSVPAFATNGMNMEGYGPVATGMGGASAAYDNGTAGLINNPATLGMMKSGTARFDIAIGGLHPTIDANVQSMSAAGRAGGMFPAMPGGSATSDGTAYFMPAIGYVRKDGAVTWGIGMMSQGGMGTEWGSNSMFSSNVRSADFNVVPAQMNAIQTTANGLENRSELGIGRVLVPLTFDVSDTLRIGGTVDYLWGGLDMRMVLPGATLANMVVNSNAFVTGGMAGLATGSATPFNQNAFGSAAGAGVANLLGNPALGGQVDYAYIDASEGTNKFNQRLTTSGTGVNVGFQWQATPTLGIGAVYHAKTNLKDMSGSATMMVDNRGAAGVAAVVPRSALTPVSGTLKVIDFQWPETYGVGLAYQATDRLMLAMDYKNIAWSNTMKNFRMKFDSAMGAMDMYINLNWEDQNVFQFGGAYKVDDALTLRAGFSLANNPVKDQNMVFLFPATTTNHFTLGLGYAMSKTSSIEGSFAYAPEVSVTNQGNAFSAAQPGVIDPVSIGHSQTNWQLMFSNKF